MQPDPDTLTGAWPQSVTIVELAARDSLQNLPQILPPHLRVQLIDYLSLTGIKRLLEQTARHIPVQALAAHFHNTYSQALVNVFALLEEGLSVIDTSVTGLGGCPYAPGASGNLATEDAVYMLEEMGIRTVVNMKALLKAATFICDQLGITSRSGVGLALTAGLAQKQR